MGKLYEGCADCGRLMIVSHTNRFIFLHNPKCAGTSFRESIAGYHDDAETFWKWHRHDYFSNQVDYGHLRLWELHAIFPHIFSLIPEYNSLVLVRNPYERFISALAEHLTTLHHNLDIYSTPAELQARYAERFIEEELRMERVLGNVTFIHFSLQIWFIRLGEQQMVRHVLPVPRDDAGWADVFGKLNLPPEPVGRLNHRGGPLAHLLRSERVLDWIEKFYKSDFDWLRAQPNLAGLAARPESNLRSKCAIPISRARHSAHHIYAGI